MENNSSVNKANELGKKTSKEKKIYENIFAFLSISVFLLISVFFGFMSMVDVDETISEKENRVLASKPDFSWSSLFNGTFTKDFENYYSDTFPLRDSFMEINNYITKILTQFGGKEENVIISYEKYDSDFVGEGIDFGIEIENDNGNKGNTEEKDNHNHSTENEVSFKGSILISGTRAMEVFMNSSTMTSNYASLVNKTAAAMPEGVQFYSMIAPTSVEFYGTKNYSSGVYSQKDAINSAYSKIDNSVIKIDAYSYLNKVTDEYIYFRTDHHWTARGAYQGYLAFCNATQQTPVKLEELETGKIDNFVGSLYKASNADVIKKNPDYVEYFKTRVDVNATVYANGEMKNGKPCYVVARAVNSDNKYLAFIGGDQPLEKIVTSNKNGKKILVIKESFGNALVPFLCDNYEEVYVLDPRKTNFDLPEFVEKQGIGEVLMINYSFAMANKTFSDSLYSMID